MRYLPLFVAVLSISAFAATHPKQRQQSSEMMPMPIVAPLFIEGSHFSSDITVVNDGMDSSKVTIELFDESGKNVGTRSMTLEGHSQSVLHVSDLITTPNPGSRNRVIGSVQIMPEIATVAAQLSLTYDRPGAPLHIEEEFSMPSETSPAEFRGVAASVIGSPIIALKNNSQRNLTFTVQCVLESRSAAARTVELKPMELRLSQPCSGSKEDDNGMFEPPHPPESQLRGAVGVSISSDATEEELAVYGFARSKFEGEPKLSSMFFMAPKDLNSSQTGYVGVAMGKTETRSGKKYSSELSLSNFSSDDVSVFVAVASSQPGGVPVTENQTITVPGMSSKTVAISSEQPNPALENSVLVESASAPGIVMTKLLSFGMGNEPVMEYQPKDIRQKENSGLHPWSLANGQQSTLFLFNHDAKKQFFNVGIYSGGSAWERAYELGPSETKALDIWQLVSQAQDDQGRKLPKNVVTGELQWSTPQRYKGIGRLLVTDKQTSLARNFSCGQCVNVCDARISPNNSITIILDGVGILGNAAPGICIDQGCACQGRLSRWGGSGYFYGWSSVDTNIAAINGSSTGTSANFLGTGVGSDTGEVDVNDGTCDGFADGPIAVEGPYRGTPVADVFSHAASFCATGSAG
jgi:hypothetical protein